MFIRFLFENSGFKSLAARRKELKSWGRIISDGYNHVIKLLICFQLIFYPITSSAQNIPEEQYRQTQLDTVEAYNQKIDSLFEHIFGPRSSTQFYTNHPLDFYSLIGQNVIMKETSSKKPKETKKPFFTHINPDRLLVEIISIDGAGEEKVEAILNSSGNSIKNKIPQEAKDLYTGVQYSIQNKELLHSFKLSYQGQILHNFSNHIQWIAIFGPYLVFMEGAQIYEQRAMLSFIDLNYFRTAIGKTALPIFRIPMAIESLNKAEILTPQITDNELSIGQNKNHKITRKELDAFTHIQHVIFSVLVSLLSIDRYERDMIPFFKDISNEIERLLQNQRATRVQNLEATERPSGFVESHHVVEKIISEIIKSRVDLGSPSHQTGHYGQVKAAQHRLEPLELNELDNEAYQKSLAHLEADQKFQNHIKEVYRQKLEERKIKERVKGLVAQLLVPQPLGALKIQKSLGLIANSVRKGGSIEDRVMALEKKIIALEQENKSVRSRTFTRSRILIALPVLAGAAGLASQEGALFYEYIFRYVGETLFAFGNVLFENGKQALSSLNIPQAYRTYLSDGKGFSFAVGTLSVISTMFALFITLQVMVNLRHFLRYLKTQRAYEHEVTASVHRKKILDHFKSFISETRQAYAENLARGEFKK
ncbi:MAG: hypothetical protein OXH36_04065, partial [Bdellovibrionales bacterium]|nr:hypothetical protein [Bdellovibrionales bacterium]